MQDGIGRGGGRKVVRGVPGTPGSHIEPPHADNPIEAASVEGPPAGRPLRALRQNAARPFALAGSPDIPNIGLRLPSAFTVNTPIV